MRSGHRYRWARAGARRSSADRTRSVPAPGRWRRVFAILALTISSMVWAVACLAAVSQTGLTLWCGAFALCGYAAWRAWPKPTRVSAGTPEISTALPYYLIVVPITVGFALVFFAHQASASPPPDCGKNPNPLKWFVKAGASSETAIGTETRPFSSLAEAQRCSDEGSTIVVVPGPRSGPPLDGGIVLKNGQKLLGGGNPKRDRLDGRLLARITNTGGSGDAVVLGNDNEVAYLHIESPRGAAILGDNVAGANLHDLLITRQTAVATAQLGPSLCRVVATADAIDNAASTLRGCHVFLLAAQKSPITLLADDRSGHISIVHTVRKVTIVDSPNAENADLLWSAAIYAISAGHVEVTLNIEATSIENSFRGIIARASDRAVVTLNVRDMQMDNLTSDGINLQTGFICSGMKKGDIIGTVQCMVSTPRGPLAPAPVSDAKVVLNARRFRFRDTKHKGREEAGAIEPVAFDQGRSIIEVHVEDSDLIGAAAPGFFTYYVPGRPARDIIDFGCVNPNPGAPSKIGKDRAACRARGFTSAGRNRIFANSAKQNPPRMEVALSGPGRMMAQGNYWGDLHPRDGRGDALGQCSVWDANEAFVRVIENSRCKLFRITGQGNPDWIDGRFHLIKDPRPSSPSSAPIQH